MADGVPGYTPVPLGRAGTGSAYVLGRTTPDALSILIQGQRNRDYAARLAAQAKLKQEQEIAKGLDDRLKYNTKGGQLYQTPLNDQIYKGLEGNLVSIARQESDGKLDHFEARRQEAALKNNAESERVLSEAKQAEYDKAVQPVMADKGRDAAAFHQGYVTSLRDPTKPDDMNAWLLPSQHDHVAALATQDNNPLTYVADEQVKRHLQGRQAKTLADAEAGRIGGLHSSQSLTYNGVVVQRQHDGTYAPQVDKNGRPVVDITQDDLVRDRGGNHAFDMGMKRLEVQEAERAAAEGRPAKDALTLYKEAASPYVSFKQVVHEGLNRLPPQPKSTSGAAGFDIPSAPPTFEGEGRYNMTTQAGDRSFYSGVTDDKGRKVGFSYGDTPTHPDFATHGQPLPQPMFRAKSGKLSEVEVEGFTPPEIMQKGADGISRPTKYNGQAMTGKFGPAVPVYTDVKTNELLPVQSRAEGEALVRSGKANLRLQIDFHQRSNKNWATDVKELANKLLGDRDELGHPKYHSLQEAEAVAQKRLSGGLERVPVMYSPRNAAVIGRLSGPLYGMQNAALMAEQRRLRAQGSVTPKAKQDPLGFAAPAAPKAPVKAATKQKANPLGF